MSKQWICIVINRKYRVYCNRLTGLDPDTPEDSELMQV
jgi:hypothetical protein